MQWLLPIIRKIGFSICEIWLRFVIYKIVFASLVLSIAGAYFSVSEENITGLWTHAISICLEWKWLHSHQNHQYWSFKTVWLTRVYGMNKQQLHMQNFDMESIIINLLSVFIFCSVNLHCKDSCKANIPWKVYFGRSFVYYENVQITQQITSIWQAINIVIHGGWTEEILTMCDDITQTFT